MLFFLNSKQIIMNCSACSNPYKTQNDKTGSVPRVLLVCGHTFCHNCIESNFLSGKIVCFQCCKNNQTSRITNFPINETLMSLIRSNNMIADDHFCPLHKKKLEVYCQKQSELICLECTLNKHKAHKSCLISEKAAKDRLTLKDCTLKVQQSLDEQQQILNQLDSFIKHAQDNFKDYCLQVGVFFNDIIEQINSLKNKELQKGQQDLNEYSNRLKQQQAEASEKYMFLKELQSISQELMKMSDVDLIKKQAKKSFLIENCKHKRTKYSYENIEFKRINCLQEVINNLQDLMIYERKRKNANQHCSNLIQNNSQISPSPVKKHSVIKQPAVLEVNLNQQYNKRLNKKSSKPTKKIINISSLRDKEKEKEKIVEAITTRTVSISYKQTNKEQVKYSREGSSKKRKEVDIFHDQFQSSNNFTPASIHSFMRTSRAASDINLSNQESTIREYCREGFGDFTLLDLEQKIYHFGGKARNFIQKYKSEEKCSEKLKYQFNKHNLQCVIWKNYSLDKCLLIGGSHNFETPSNGDYGQVYEFNFKTQKLQKTNLNISEAKSSFGCAVKDSYLFIVGGRGKQVLNTFERYTFQKNRLVCFKMANMNQYRDQLGCCLGYDGYLYAAGGVNLVNQILNSCERFNWQKMSWQVLPSMKVKRLGFMMVTVPHGIFAIGGHNGTHALNEVDFFDFQTKQWKGLCSMKEARCLHSALVSKDYQFISVFGGFRDAIELDSIEIYDIGNNKWIDGGKMKDKRSSHSSVYSPF